MLDFTDIPAKAYPYTISHEVIFRDLDAMGHVNHAMFFTYMETIRTKYLAKFIDISGGFHHLGVILGEATCRYRTPAYFGETLTIGVAITRFGSKSFDMSYRMDGENGRLIATGETGLIMYNYQQEQTVLISDAFKQQVLTFQENHSS